MRCHTSDLPSTETRAREAGEILRRQTTTQVVEDKHRHTCALEKTRRYVQTRISTGRNVNIHNMRHSKNSTFVTLHLSGLVWTSYPHPPPAPPTAISAWPSSQHPPPPLPFSLPLLRSFSADRQLISVLLARWLPVTTGAVLSRKVNKEAPR